MSKILSHSLKPIAGIAATLAFAGTAQAGCGTYCGNTHSGHGASSHSYAGQSYSGQSYSGEYTGTSTLAPLSSYYSSGGHGVGGYVSSSDAGYSTSYTTSYTMSASEASASYGSGSISSTYTGGDVEIFGYSGAPDLGAGESLQATDCPVNVIGASHGSRVLGCYNVVRQEVRPVANTTYYRVVRPVIYVRYPVPVPVPYTVNVPSYRHGGCGGVNWSRYGGFGPQGGYGLGCR